MHCCDHAEALADTGTVPQETSNRLVVLLEEKTATITHLSSENERLKQANHQGGNAVMRCSPSAASSPHSQNTSADKVAQGLWMLEEALLKQEKGHAKQQQEQQALLHNNNDNNKSNKNENNNNINNNNNDNIINNNRLSWTPTFVKAKAYNSSLRSQCRPSRRSC
jgi:hypothetical protein